jgi:phosphoribosylglycinamide formyltransferase-1
MTNLAIFASGKGSNADNICRYFKDHNKIKAACILSDRKAAGVFEVAAKYNLAAVYLNIELLQQPEKVLDILKKHNIGFIVLAGYLKLMPSVIINSYRNKIVNIHPALLPKYGGKGMYGMKVHESVCSAGDNESGITVHYVNEHYDEGDVVFQTKVTVGKTDSPDIIAEKIHKLEMEYFPKVIEELILAN